ncbi:MAG: secondary thiamine-phosphate synthase enzyme YjbQ [Armatimonadota bacterium]|nr:secondary thiamine-phosphate synthase enzyme YjbQ [Armatimonadota bacterium]MDR7400682.1 secondary thiamine-phosphate synthase enzyme YjbQ [Armatimonadota bacterium]MDR7403615.1 secondary thiamine-phosphate synthase enzyme YjbQ [Armatimonadota bacterium]MDR7436507.1 secondary thiamine-phosphate synthase enzyme YjbQ [Armatimonadota bacterium]MDR7472542.1 secondary thiamine-phosphate synthase enzyme YjbQ [Armatimonadota bacterium]
MTWHTVSVRSRRRVEVIDITEAVAAACGAGASGLAVVVCPHTTAAVCVNEAEPHLLADLERWLERMVPAAAEYAHNRIDDNADAHLRALLLGHCVCVPVDGGLQLGRWQRILFVELDGPRQRQVRVAVVG